MGVELQSPAVLDGESIWFWPLSILVKRGLYDYNMEPQPLNPEERVYFYQEDLHAVIEYAEPDLPEPESPWRRVYGPALNSNLLDRGFLFGSLGIIIVLILAQYLSNSALLIDNLSKCVLLLIAYFSIIALFIGGELDRKDQEAPFGKNQLYPLKSQLFEGTIHNCRRFPCWSLGYFIQRRNLG